MQPTKGPVQFLTMMALLVASSLANISSNYNSSQSAFALDLNTDRISNETMRAACSPDSPNCPPRDGSQRETWFSPELDTYLRSSAVLYGLIVQSSPATVSRICYANLQALADGIHRRNVWAMKMLDASATAQPGFVWGNNFWLGSRKQCESIHEQKKHITLSSRFERRMKSNLVDDQAPFPVGYRVAFATHQSPWQVQVEFLLSRKVLHLGLCVPSSCSISDLTALSQSYLDSSLMEAQNLFVHQAQVVQVKDFVLTDEFYSKNSLKIVGLFLLVTVMLVTMAAGYDKTTSKQINGTVDTASPSNASHHPTNYDEIRSMRANNLPSVINDHIQVVSPPHTAQQPIAHHEQTLLQRLVGCFSIQANFQTIMSTRTGPAALPAINAFKSIGCILILNFHFIWYSLNTLNNSTEAFALGEQLQWQWLSTAPLIVDIFFIISGLLLAYNFLRNKSRCEQIRSNSFAQNSRLFARQFLHRYLRLTPLYLAVVGGSEITASYLAVKSPFWMAYRTDLTCQQHWWRNVLYVQNLYPVDDLCANWSWSLACEMQFFMLCTILLFVYVKHPEAARKIFVATFIGFAAILVAILWHHQFTTAYDVMHTLGSELYIAPWVRVLPYLLGLGCGWYLHTNPTEPLPMTQKNIKLIWTLAVTAMVMCTLITYVRDISYVYIVPITVFVRLAYASGACWTIVACAKGHGGWFTEFTSLSVFVHINKLSYGIYLLNPIVIMFIYGSASNSTTLDPIVQITTAAGVVFIVYLLSFACSLLFEVPYTKLSAEILRGRPKTKVA